MKYSESNKPLVCMMTQSTCYKGTRRFTPKGILWHSTGANNPTLKRYVQPDDNAKDRAEWLAKLGRNQYGNDWNHIDHQAGLNFWIGKLADGTVAAVQTMPWDYRPWGCGSGSKGSCNDTHIQFEICEDALADASYFNACYKEACEMTAYLCRMYSIDPKGTISYNGMKVPTIIDHIGSHNLGLGTNHGDVQHWFKRFGKTLDNVRNDVAVLLAEDGSEVSAPAVPTPVESGLAKGDKGDAVKVMQAMLIACGYSCGPDGADGDFGRNTLAGLKAFQTTTGLTVTGVYDKETKAALEKAYGERSTTPTATTDEAKLIWDRLYTAIQNPYGVAGVMGNFKAESNCQANNLQNTCEKSLGMTDEQYTAAVDNGSYTNFVHDSAGYGLYQATYWSIKESLLNYAKAHGKSIGDRDMQVDQFIEMMKNSYSAVWKALTTAKTVREASDAVLLKFERPADQSEAVQEKRAGYGEEFFAKYATITPTTAIPAAEPESQKRCTAAAVIAVAVAEIGYKEKASNASLDDKTANAGSANYTKYARDFDQKYPNWYNGKKNGYAWCDMFVDWCFLTAFGYENALRLLCQPEKSAGAGCTYSLRYYRNKGQFHTSSPKTGDQIFFGTSIDNSTHTGIVEKVDGGKVYTIEGNTSDQVARRSYALSNSRILGYGRPAYDTMQTITPAAPTTSTAQEGGTVEISAAHAKYINSTGTHYISNSGSDENKQYKGGQAGDQTGKEWCMRSWYNRPWNVVLRYPDQKVALKIAQLGIDAALNDRIGYDQSQNRTYLKQLKAVSWNPSKITVPCEADCSAGVCANITAAGYLLGIDALKNHTGTYTGNMRGALVKAGFKALTESKYLTSGDYLLPGDILLYESHHTATNVTIGKKVIGDWNPGMVTTPPEIASTETAPTTTIFYRVRKSWSDKASQIGAFTVFQNAKNCVDANPGYAAFDDSGKRVYPVTTFQAYSVKVSISELNCRKGPSMSYESNGYIEPGIYTIVDEQDGWGLLKSYADERNGWIELSLTSRV